MNEINSPKHWKNVQLKEIASLRRESIQPENDLCLNYVGLEHIDSGESQLKRWGNASEVKSTKSRFYANDILYGKLRAYLDKVVIAEMEGICSTDILVVTANSKTIPRFLVYLLHTQPLIRHAVATSTGVNHPRTSWNSLGEFVLALPPLSEQRAIAHVLQTIQEAKFTRQREIELERERRAALMEYLFSHGTKGEPRKQTEIGDIPESWEIVQLKEIANLRRENVKPKDSQNLNFVGLEHIDSGESTLKRWGDASAMKSAKNRFYPDDVLYGKLRSYLDKAVIAEMDGICSTDILVFAANSKILPRFLVYLLHTETFVNHAVATSTGISHPRTSWDSLGKFTFTLPSLPEQRAIAAVFQAIDEKTAALEREVEHLAELFHTMLDELMTGQRSAVPLIVKQDSSHEG
ncbi:MAG: restriction endonuclease subunit S [Candidatus Poribacteria bacterium]|nr:restriction endonuclease subunit S [Candidatus Poribacteria bacterium]